jgi:outer membrane lipoprotein-sorting protein
MLRQSLAAFALLLCVSGSVAAQSADEVIARSFAAQGGIDKLKAISAVRMTGRMNGGPGMEAPIVIEMKRPKLMRAEISVQGTTIVQVFDGTKGWMLNPMSGRNTPEAMPADMAKVMDEQADMDGPLMDYAAKGHSVELLGREGVNGADCFKLKLTQKDGTVTTFYIDATTFLTVKQESRRSIGGNEIDAETIVGDWRQVDGVMFPFSIDAGQKGGGMRQKMTIDKIDVNPALDDARFRMQN